jgi:hypothetical protein
MIGKLAFSCALMRNRHRSMCKFHRCPEDPMTFSSVYWLHQHAGVAIEITLTRLGRPRRRTLCVALDARCYEICI